MNRNKPLTTEKLNRMIALGKTTASAWGKCPHCGKWFPKRGSVLKLTEYYKHTIACKG